MGTDLTMTIAAAGMSMKQTQLQQAVDVALLKKAMKSETDLAAQTLKTLQSIPEPSRLLDITV